jgi:hypothetical protein
MQTGHNEEYLENSMKFARGVVITAGLISMTPKILKPLVNSVYQVHGGFPWLT